MKHKAISHFSFLCALVFALEHGARAEALKFPARRTGSLQVNAGPVAEEIKQRTMDFFQAWSNPAGPEWNKLATYYPQEGGVYFDSTVEKPLYSFEQIKRDFLKSPLKSIDITAGGDVNIIVERDIAVVIMTVTVVVKPKTGAILKPETSRQTGVWEKRGDAWQIVHGHLSLFSPPNPPPPPAVPCTPLAPPPVATEHLPSAPLATPATAPVKAPVATAPLAPAPLATPATTPATPPVTTGPIAPSAPAAATPTYPAVK